VCKTVCTIWFLIANISESYKEENLCRVTVIRVMQCTVVRVMKVFAVACNESTQPRLIRVCWFFRTAHSQEGVPGSCTETCPTSHDANQPINIKVEVSDLKEEENPVPISFPGKMAKHVVSSFFYFPADSRGPTTDP
jgi:hypothetical protein